MCGIVGILRFKGVDSLDCAVVRKMTAQLSHRGPDAFGEWSDTHVALGHTRLSVIDLSPAGSQPMGNEDGTVQLVYNGEVYNFRELKQRHALAERGHTFRSRTDTEVLVHLYEELGLRLLEALNGMFALAIWDVREHTLHLARDRYGIKPLFYQRDGNCFRFASEIKAILADPRVPRKIRPQALHDFLTFDYIPGPQTAFEGILEVPPGHCISVAADGATTVWRYWNPSFTADESISETWAIEQARGLLERAVSRQLVADVPIGVLLSGGMDSSTLVALMSRQTKGATYTYSVGFEDRSFNELPYARLVARHFGAVHREVVVTPQRVRQLFPKYLRFIDEPYADGSAIPTYCVCERAKGEVVVLLSGEGGDEAFAGYDTYAAYKMARWFRKVPRWLRQGVVQPLVNRLPVSDKKLSLEFRLKRFLAGVDLRPAEAHLWWRIVLTEAQKMELYSNSFREHFEPEPSIRHFLNIFCDVPANDELSRLLAIDSLVFLPDDLMIKNDRMSMAHSLETRVPMTDHELTDFLSRVPARLKLPGLRRKHIMRRAMEGMLPAAILKKRKVGLEMPYSRWLKNELHDVLLRYCAPKHVSETGIFRAEAVKLLIDEHLSGRADHGRALWGLMNYMAWLELYSPRL